MISFLWYLLEVTIIQCILYIFYCIFFSQSGNYIFRRSYILFLITISFILPLLEISVSENINFVSPQIFFIEDEVIAANNIIETQTNNSNGPVFRQLFQYLYFAGLMLFLIYFLISIQKINQFLKFKIRDVYGKLKLMESDNSISPFSFFNYVIIPYHHYSEDEIKTIIEHERIHAQQLHSIDKLFIEIIQIILWFNPINKLLKKSMNIVHELQVDSAIIKKGIDKRHYQYLLIKQVSYNLQYKLASNLNKLLIKKRIKIMNENKKSKLPYLGALLILPALVLVFMGFSVKEKKIIQAPQKTSIVKNNVNDVPSICPVDDCTNSVSLNFGLGKHPIKKTNRMHNGIDFRGNTGDNIYATASGVIVKTDNLPKSHGKHIIIKHSDTYTTFYSHLSEILVKEGQKIKSGETIGKMGSTGMSTGPHLHYEVRKNNECVNPNNYY